MQERNPVFVYIFEATNSLGCIIFSLLIWMNAGGWFFPKIGAIYSGSDLWACVKSTVIVLIVFVIVVGIPLLLLFVDCFVIMKGVEGFHVSVMSVLLAPASYPMIRTNALEEPPVKRNFHLIAGSLIFCTNIVFVISIIYYFIRIIMSFVNVI